LGSTTIESINYSGQVTSMLGYATYRDNRSAAVPAIVAGHFTPDEHPDYNQGFATKKGYIFSTTPLGCFTFHIPLKQIFGFASDYKKVIYGMKQSLILTRTSNMEAVY